MSNNNENSNGGRISFDKIVLIIITSLAAGLVIAVIYEFIANNGNFDNFLVTYIVSTIIFLPIDYLLFSYKYKCKKCGTKWAREETHTEDIDKYTKTKTENYQENNVTKTKEVKYRVREYWQYFKCKNCGDITREREKSEKRI